MAVLGDQNQIRKHMALYLNQITSVVKVSISNYIINHSQISLSFPKTNCSLTKVNRPNYSFRRVPIIKCAPSPFSSFFMVNYWLFKYVFFLFESKLGYGSGNYYKVMAGKD